MSLCTRNTLLLCALKALISLSLTGSASRTDLSQLANGIWEIYAGCTSFLRVSSVAKIGYIPQFKASNARDQDEVSSDLARMRKSSSAFFGPAQNISWCDIASLCSRYQILAFIFRTVTELFGQKSILQPNVVRSSTTDSETIQGVPRKDEISIQIFFSVTRQSKKFPQNSKLMTFSKMYLFSAFDDFN